MKSIIAILLLAASAFTGYLCWEKYDSATSKVELGPLEIRTGNTETLNEAYALGAVSIVLLIGGIYLLSRKR